MPVTTLRERIAISYNEDHIEYGFPSKENDNALFLSLKAAECSGPFLFLHREHKLLMEAHVHRKAPSL